MPAPDGYILSPRDYQALARLLRDSGYATGQGPPPGYTAQDVFICKVSDVGTGTYEDGIDALQTAEEADEDYDVPGSALCDVYHVAGGMLQPIGPAVTVYNLGRSPTGNGYFLAVRTKWGSYIAAWPGQRPALMCRAQAKIASGHVLERVDNVTPMDFGYSPVGSSDDELTLISDYETDDDAWGIIAWDHDAQGWRPVDFPCSTGT